MDLKPHESGLPKGKESTASPTASFIRRYRDIMAVLMVMGTGLAIWHATDPDDPIFGHREKEKGEHRKSEIDKNWPDFCAPRPDTFFDELKLEDECHSGRGDLDTTHESNFVRLIRDRLGLDSTPQIARENAINWASAVERQKKGGREFAGEIEALDDKYVEVDACTKLGKLPSSYTKILREFNPSLYSRLKGKVYIRSDRELLMDVGVMGATHTNGAKLEAGLLNFNEPGDAYYVELQNFISEIDLRNADERKIRRFVSNAMVLAHEVYGHAHQSDISGKRVDPSMDAYRAACGKDSNLVRVIEGEIFARYMGAKMLHFLTQRFPKIKAIVLKERMKMMNADLSAESADDSGEIKDDADPQDEMQELIFYEQIMALDAYTNALETNDWAGFKEKLLVKKLIRGYGVGFPFILDYLKEKGDKECFETLNRKMRTVMKDSPPQARLTESQE